MPKQKSEPKKRTPDIMIQEQLQAVLVNVFKNGTITSLDTSSSGSKETACNKQQT
jgi:hypothetical protein